MVVEHYLNTHDIALEDFDRVHRKAVWENLIAQLLGRPSHCVDFNDIEIDNPLENPKTRLREIYLTDIVGSVGRAQDYTPSFMPLKTADRERWASIKQAVLDMRGLPPIELYQVGNDYYVLDGNHRLSVSHHLGVSTITAYVTKIA